MPSLCRLLPLVRLLLQLRIFNRVNLLPFTDLPKPIALACESCFPMASLGADPC